MTAAESPVLNALDQRAYAYLETTAPDLLTAVEREIAEGVSPAEIVRKVLRHNALEHKALAVTVGQAARHVQRTMRG